jgi:hypothetical protein
MRIPSVDSRTSPPIRLQLCQKWAFVEQKLSDNGEEIGVFVHQFQLGVRAA